MKHTEEIEIPARTETRVCRITCDMCGEDVDNMNHTEEEVIVYRKTIDGNLDSFETEETTVDLCGQCFKDKLIPWLESQGVKPLVKKRSY